MYKKILITICLSFFVLIIFCKCQTSDTLVVAFWNLQNLFDTYNDPLKDDEEFLPDGEMEWTEDRLDKKMFNLARVIRSINNKNGPDLIGVCEVENQAVLDSMIKKFLPDLNYKVAYLESPDNRGIDNGLIFRIDKFRLLSLQADTVHLSEGYPTRLIFGATLLTGDDMPITVFVNHWPSRRGGQLESEPNRIEAAKTLRAAVDRIFESDPNSKILILGDFNDDPLDVSLLDYLKAYPVKCDSITTGFEFDSSNELFNLSYSTFEDGTGSYKYQQTWNMLDQIIISGSFFTDEKFHYVCNSFEVYKPYFLLTHSGKFEGTPFPTYGSRRYLGGYSDHFPVTAKFIFKGKRK